MTGQRRLFDHASHANFRVESSLARGSPDAATSTRWDLGRTTGRMAAYFRYIPKSLYSNYNLILKFL
ncbi:hypothetical protein V1477_015050 [Vespula maculifrons]|uniref:Uncharacterized protein n=1 Tax=Vespula maculifrons TaxID=7453 RepID=A0ABD2BJP6_VESMC